MGPAAALRGLLLDTDLLGSRFDERPVGSLLVAAVQETCEGVPSVASQAVVRALGTPGDLAYDHSTGWTGDMAGRRNGRVQAMIEVKTNHSKFNWYRNPPHGHGLHALMVERGWARVDQLTRYRTVNPGVQDNHRVLVLPQRRLERLQCMVAHGEEAGRPRDVSASEWGNTPVAELVNWQMVSWESVGEALRHSVPEHEVAAAEPALHVVHLMARG